MTTSICEATASTPNDRPSMRRPAPLDPIPWYRAYTGYERSGKDLMMTLTIGQVAAAAAVNIQTIRYYERRGLFTTPRRTPAGYRQYTEDAVTRLRFIRHAQELGFSLKE